MSNQDVIAKLLAHTETVVTQYGELELRRPDLETMAWVREIGIRFADKTEQPSAADLELAATMTTKLVANCLQVDADVAQQLVMATGGDNGELAQAALRLAGLDTKLTAQAETIDADF